MDETSDSMKKFHALLNGLIRRIYYNDAELTNSFLKSQIYPNANDEEFLQMTERHSGLIKSIVSADMDFHQLDAFLTSQLKRKEGSISTEQSNVYTKFWKNHKSKVHEIIMNESIWNNRLHSYSWRIDVKTSTQNLEQINTPTAIMELQLINQIKKDVDVVKFEVTEGKLKEVLSVLQDINEKIDSVQSSVS